MSLLHPQEVDYLCSECGRKLTQYQWWDDPPEHGGAYLEDTWWCTPCDREYEKYELKNLARSK